MIVICTTCKKVIGAKEPYNDTTITHGKCEDCYKDFLKKTEGKSLEELMNSDILV